VEILTKKQLAFLGQAGKNKLIKDSFYLTGGTALAEFYLKHRFSEDLDFFSEKEVDPLAIDIFLKDSKDKLGIKTVDLQQSYNRNIFFLDYGGEILKTEFTYFPFARIEQGIIHEGIVIDSILDIATNKLFTIYQRTKARDYIDLYYIIKEKQYNIDNLIKNAKLKFDWHIDPLQLGTQFAKAEEAEDLPRMIKHIDNEEWRKFYLQEAKKFKKDILEN